MQSPVTDSEDIDGVIRNTLSSYKPGSTRNLQGHGFKRVFLQLFGMVGHGKSSLINSCLSVINMLPFSNEAGAGTSSESFTTTRKEYKLTDTVYIIDNQGLNKMTKDERLELSAQLRNLRTTLKVDWEFELERTVNQLEETWNNQSMDFIVPVLVYSMDCAFSKNTAIEIGPFLRDAFEITGIFPIVVLTKHKTQNTTETVRIIEELGPHHIFVLDNYSTSNSVRSLSTDSEVPAHVSARGRSGDSEEAKLKYSVGVFKTGGRSDKSGDEEAERAGEGGAGPQRCHHQRERKGVSS